jgi:hypothetical protein
MGWWSEEILSGDQPLDAICDFQKIAKINTDKLDDLPEGHKRIDSFGFTSNRLRKHFKELTTFCFNKQYTDERHTSFQALGQLCIITKTPLTKEEKIDFTSYAKDPRIKEWRSPEERRARISEWATNIAALPGI